MRHMWRTYRLVRLLGLSSTPAPDGSLGYGNSTYIALGSPGGYGGDIVSLYPAGETPAPGGRSAMMCDWGSEAIVDLCAPMDVSGRTQIAVDQCLAPLVQALNDYGVHTVGCCCGHGKSEGSVLYEQSGTVYELVLGEQRRNAGGEVAARGKGVEGHSGRDCIPVVNPPRL